MGNLSTHAASPANKIVVPVRYAAWLAGDLGRSLERTLQTAISSHAEARVSRIARGFLVESPESPGPLLEAVHHAALQMEAGVEAAYPVFHHEMGPVWTGTLQAVFV